MTPYPPAASPYTPSTASVGVTGVARALGRGTWSQFHPHMLFALLLPFVVALLGAIILLWLAWTPLTGWLRSLLEHPDMLDGMDPWLTDWGVLSIKVWLLSALAVINAGLVPMIAGVILLPMAGILGLAVAAVVVMPIVLNHVSAREYPGLERRGRYSLVSGIWNATWVTVVFIVGWLVTLPLWLIPPLAAVLPVLWWMFAFTRMLRFDALADHASPAERRTLFARHNTGFWALGLIFSLINLLPPAWIFLPVLSSLVFVHYALDALRRLRLEQPLPPADNPFPDDVTPSGADSSFNPKGVGAARSLPAPDPDRPS